MTQSGIRDYQHIGKVSDEKQQVAADILAKYVGVHTIGSPDDKNYLQLTVTLA